MKIKKSIGAILIVCLIATFATPAFADEMSPQITMSSSSSEYDLLVSLSQEEESALLNTYDIEAKSIEQVILERAMLSVEELTARGYNPDQIAILKEYDGSPIENNPQLKKVLGELQGELDIVSANRTSAVAKFNWKWINQPLLSGSAVKDIVACAWRGTDNSNQECTMTFNEGKSHCNITYRTNMNTYKETLTIVEKDAQRNIEVKIPMHNDRKSGWAESGELQIAVEEEKTIYNMYSTLFVFAYGHMTLTLSPSISVTANGASLGLSCGFGTSEEFNDHITVKYDGTYS